MLSEAKNHVVNLQGVDAQSYVYKYGVESQTDCQNSEGYSPPISIAEPISIMVDSYTEPYVLCALGVGPNSERQDPSDATKWVWNASWPPFTYLEMPGQSTVGSTSSVLNIHAPSKWTSMYITSDPSCASGGTWQTKVNQTPVVLTPDATTKVAKVFTIFKDSDGKLSNCVSSQIIVSTPASITTCSGSTTTDALHGEFIDSGGPSGDYSDNESCEVIITGGPRKFTFVNFDTESGFDELKIFKNSATGSNTLVNHSGSSLPAPLDSFSETNIVQFSSDGSVTAAGYKVTWQPLVISTNSLAIAGGSSTTTSSIVTLNITSLEYLTEMYITNDSSCNSGGSWTSVLSSMPWVLSNGNGNKTVYIKFRDPNLIESPCESDSILMYEGAPTAVTLSGLPTNNSGNDNLAVSVGGTDIAGYKFKFGPSGSTDCTSSVGYSIEHPVSSQISSSLIPYGSGMITLCVIGINPIGTSQSLSSPTTHSWFRDVPLFVQFESSGSLVTEGVSSVSFKLVANGNAILPVTVDYDIYGDFVTSEGFTSGQATIPAGSSEVTITLPITANPVQSTDRRISVGISALSAPHKQGLISTSTIQVIDAQRPALGVLDIGYFSKCAVLSDGKLVCREHVGGPTFSTDRWVEGFQQHVSSVSFSSVVTDSRYMCALSSIGELYCWGWGFDGQLGLGTSVDHSYPQKVNGYTWKKVVASKHWNNLCGIDSNDDLYCWGDGTYSFGLNGSGGTTDQRSPYLIDSGNKYKDVVIDGYNACAITLVTNQLKCWGANLIARVGDGTTTDKLSPTLIDSGVGYNFVNLGPSVGLGITTTGAWKAWGSRYYSALGGTALVPETVDASRVYTTLVGGDEIACGLSNGYLYCIAYDWENSMGFGQYVTTPALIDSSAQYSQILAKNHFVCGITLTTNLIKCFGRGLSSTGSTSATISIPKLPTVWDSDTFSKLIPVDQGLCAITTSGIPKCLYVRTGSPTGSNLHRETAIARLSDSTVNIRQITNNYVLDESNRLYQRGYNIEGDYSFDRRTNPFRIWPNHSVSKIAESSYLDCFITTSSKLFCWGDNPGDNTTGASSPVAVDSANDYLSVSVGSLFGCAITLSNDLKCWGSNSSGQLGLGDTVTRLTPTFVGSGFAKVSAAMSHVCALKTTGELYCWGTAPIGLGNGSTLSLVPVQINPGTTFIDVVTGQSNCAIRSDNSRVMCWGSGIGIGNSSLTNQTALTLTSDTNAYQQLSIKSDDTVSVICGETSGTVKCWGSYAGLRMLSPQLVYTGTVKYIYTGSTNFVVDTNGKLHHFGSTAAAPFGQQSYPKLELLMGLVDRVAPIAP